MIAQCPYYVIYLERNITFCKKAHQLYFSLDGGMSRLFFFTEIDGNILPQFLVSKKKKKNPKQLMTEVSAVQIGEDKPLEHVGLFACSLCCNS